MLKKITFISFLVLVIALCLFKMPSSYSKLDKSADSKNSIELKSYANSYCKSENCNFDYTGTEQMFIAPKSGKYKIEAWGASGGKNYCIDRFVDNENEGGYVSGNIFLNKYQKLYFYVGGSGKNGNTKISQEGGYNGGGIGQASNDNNDGGGSGGGSTDVRIESFRLNNFSSLKSRIMVSAGGGGGATIDCSNSTANNSNGISGGLYGYGNIWAWQNYILSGNYNSSQTKGYKFGIGADGQHSHAGGSGAGGGYFGGLSSYENASLGLTASATGGSSSFISGHNGCVAITEDSTESNIKQRKDSNERTCTDGTTDITCSYHYSGYKFTDTIMIDGAGYNWTTVKGDYVGQPQPDGTITTGHSGNGYARITYIGE